MKAVGDLAAGVGGFEAGMFNNKVGKVNSVNALRQGTAEEAQVRDAARMAMGEQIAGQGGSGTELGVGSAADALLQSQINAEMDKLNVRRTAGLKSQGFQIEAANAKAGAYSAMLSGATKFVGDMQDYAASAGGGGGGGGGAK